VRPSCGPGSALTLRFSEIPCGSLPAKVGASGLPSLGLTCQTARRLGRQSRLPTRGDGSTACHSAGRNRGGKLPARGGWKPPLRTAWLRRTTQRQERDMERITSDVAIIGGGIVGIATALRLARSQPHLTITLLEKEEVLASHQ